MSEPFLEEQLRRIRQMSARRHAGMRFHGGQQFRARQTQFSQARAYFAHARTPVLSLSVERTAQLCTAGIDPQAQHVNGLSAPGRGNLDAGHEAQSVQGRAARGLAESGHGIVIRERQHLDAGRRRARDELGRRQRAVGAVRMRVQVDVHGESLTGEPASPTASSRRPASTMKPCARSKPSLV